MTALLTADEAARLRPGQRLVIVRAGDPAGVQAWTAACFVAPQDWVALTGPCPNTHLVEDQQLGGCRDCIDRKRIVPLYTEPTCQQPSERGDGTLCGSDYEVALVDVVRYEGDGKSTFFHLPICYGHRLALGEHVVAYEPCGRVLVGRGSIAVVPVVTPDDCEWLTFDHLQALPTETLLWRTTGNPHSPYVTTHLPALDPLPVPGRDWGIVIDCVEVAG